MKKLKEILEYRRSVRTYDSNKKIDSEKVRQCLELALLAPTSSNMQLWECLHITDEEILKKLSIACLNQSAAKTAQEMVVFITRQDLYMERAKDALTFERKNIKRNSSPEKSEERLKHWEIYYEKIMPLIYGRFFGMLGLLRKLIALSVGIFRPMMREVSESDIRVTVHKSCALAAQTFMLAMAEQNYDTCPMEGFDSRRVKKILKLPFGTEVNMIIACGIRDEETGVWGERFRVPFEKVYRKI
ncbi:MAG: nitroreductase family protein [Leptotrichiaceae bacterium]|nr:nitroreductase family protein [Leptotrichiaceae bacterium]